MKWFLHRWRVNDPLINLASGLLVLLGLVEVYIGIVLVTK